MTTRKRVLGLGHEFGFAEARGGLEYPFMRWRLALFFGLAASAVANGVCSGAGEPARTFTSQDVLLPEYTNYLASLRAAGCPEEHVRAIALSDVNEFFGRERLQEAIRLDFEWWKPFPPSRLSQPPFTEALARMEKARGQLLNRLLGTNWAGQIPLPAPGSSSASFLTGPVLGSMPLDRSSAMLEVCVKSEERMREFQGARFSRAEPIDPTEEARLRQQTRNELSRVLTAEEMEEFLVRNSHNSEALRRVAPAFNPSREEFLRIFRALDPLQCRMQLDFGDEMALSARQREDYERQCHRAVQGVLPPDRFRAYLAAVDDCYRRAQAEAENRGLDEKGRNDLYDFYRAQSVKRNRIIQDKTMAAEQKGQAIRELALEEEAFFAKLVQNPGTTK
jgi:hypothetical protein